MPSRLIRAAAATQAPADDGMVIDLLSGLRER